MKLGEQGQLYRRGTAPKTTLIAVGAEGPDLHVGSSSADTRKIRSGGVVISTSSYVGHGARSSGTMKVDGRSCTNFDTLGGG